MKHASQKGSLGRRFEVVEVAAEASSSKIMRSSIMSALRSLGYYFVLCHLTQEETKDSKPDLYV